VVYSHSVGGSTYRFADLKDVLAKASPARSGDYLAGLAARTAAERMRWRPISPSRRHSLGRTTFQKAYERP
jgi:ethanolamine ammonia-lyase large subunit